MKTAWSRATPTLAAAGLAAILMAGCSSSSGSMPSSSGSSSSSSAGAGQTVGTATGSSELGVANSALGKIVVDGKGLTVYVFDKDTKGASVSACTGTCLTQWPIVTADSSVPKASGVTGMLGTITSPDGKHQVTLNGWPLYYFVGDSAAGQTKGQGLGGVWWVVAPDGSKISGTAPTSGGY